MTNLLDRPLVPVASTDDAIATYEQLRPYLLQTEFVPIVVHVIEKAGGSPDKASVEQKKEFAEKAFDAFRKRGESDGVSVDTKLLYGTDIAKPSTKPPPTSMPPRSYSAPGATVDG